MHSVGDIDAQGKCLRCLSAMPIHETLSYQMPQGDSLRSRCLKGQGKNHGMFSIAQNLFLTSCKMSHKTTIQAIVSTIFFFCYFIIQCSVFFEEFVCEMLSPSQDYRVIEDRNCNLDRHFSFPLSIMAPGIDQNHI